MRSTKDKFALPARALELISKTTHVPQSEVTRLYEDELAELGATARVTRFLSIFALRKAEETLNHRRAAALASEQTVNSMPIKLVGSTAFEA